MYYEGYFTEGKKDGYGLEVQPNSDCYFGEFKKEKKEGIGLYLFAKGGYYYGFFKNNEKSDMGVLYSKFNYAYYFGEFVNDKKTGRGIEVCKDHSVFNGFYDGNKRAGPGIMEYSNKSTYIGEWRNGLRFGKGRLESGDLVTSGNWEYDRIKMASAVDLDDIMMDLYEKKLPQNFSSYLKASGHHFVPRQSPNVSLNTSMKPSLLDQLKIRAAEGFIRGHVFRKISNILQDARIIQNISDCIYKAFTEVPEHDQVFSPIGDKVDFKFQSGAYKLKWFCINYDNKKKPYFVLDNMIVSSSLGVIL